MFFFNLNLCEKTKFTLLLCEKGFIFTCDFRISQSFFFMLEIHILIFDFFFYINFLFFAKHNNKKHRNTKKKCAILYSLARMCVSRCIFHFKNVASTKNGTNKKIKKKKERWRFSFHCFFFSI